MAENKGASDEARYQERLLILLAEDIAPEDVRRRLTEEFCVMGEYFEAIDGRMIVVAQELVRKWGRRGSEA